MTDPSAPKQNRLLNSLPAAVYERLLPYMEEVVLPQGQVIYESGADLNHAYFPTTCIVTLLSIMENGASAGSAVVGNEGVVGVALFMGGGTMPNQAVVQSAGYAYRLKKHLLVQEFNRSGGRRSGALNNLLLRYTQSLLTQMAQIAACNRHHSVDQQLCRLLLLSLDRLPSNHIAMTQALIATMLGVRREGVAEAAGKLQKAGLIYYCRGQIKVLDRTGLEARACECYQVVKTEFDRLFLR
ncbi:Crp/Fnr family transcriptional regulator [Methylomarinum sp. Ch1-1]|uniref:Crp/Fnr family transcriptional regulator n=1 Tax=Methylomarinum roseum TaxID=3067653 RepID=A0AAU7P030_9GAMM|nr:Crp/Fnr family transcriptional regulator [Methylomarinum sp. Ch1-1]MDP4519699.1 Crp/Fnr family transcriptional regulator [Methylomarinum sp. Ch1-1]